MTTLEEKDEKDYFYHIRSKISSKLVWRKIPQTYYVMIYKSSKCTFIYITYLNDFIYNHGFNLEKKVIHVYLFNQLSSQYIYIYNQLVKPTFVASFINKLGLNVIIYYWTSLYQIYVCIFLFIIVGTFSIYKINFYKNLILDFLNFILFTRHKRLI